MAYSIGLGHPAGSRPQYEAVNFPTLPSTPTENVWCSTSTSLHHFMADKIYVRKLPTGLTQFALRMLHVS